MSETQTKPAAKAPAKRKSPAVAVDVTQLSPTQYTFHLIDKAVDQGASVETIRALMEVRDQLRREAAEEAFLTAKSSFLSSLPTVIKSKVADVRSNRGASYSYTYAGIDDIAAVIKPYLEKFGFSYDWKESIKILPPIPSGQPGVPDIPQASIQVKCILWHKLGHSDSCVMEWTVDNSGGKNAIQMRGSTSTYLRRYALTGVLGIASADQDLDAADVVETSQTLEGKLSAGEDEAAAIMFDLQNAATLGELNQIKQNIDLFADGAPKENLKRAWFARKSNLTAGV